MSNHRRPPLPPRQSATYPHQQDSSVLEDHLIQSSLGIRGRPVQRQDQIYSAQGPSAAGQGLHGFGLDRPGAEQEAYNVIQRRPTTAQYACMRERETTNSAYFDPGLTPEFGSQFMNHNPPISPDEELGGLHASRADHAMTASHYASNHQPFEESLCPRLRSALQDTHSSSGNNTTPGSINLSSSSAITFASEEPWAPAQQNPFINDNQFGSLYASSLVIPSIRYQRNATNTPCAPALLFRHRNHIPSSPLPSSNDRRRSSRPSPAASSLQYGLVDWDETSDLPERRPRRRAPSIAPPSIQYGQGRRNTLELSTGQSDHRESCQSSCTPSRQVSSSYVRSLDYTSDTHSRPARRPYGRSSTNTTATNTTSTPQSSRQSESARRFSNVPNPLPCEHPNCPHAARGLDRITNMRRHVRERHGEGAQVRCSSCGRSFTRNTALTRHQQGRRGRRER